MSLNFGSFFNNDVDITVQIDDPQPKTAWVKLNLKDNLSKARETLEKNTVIKMNDSLSFARRNNDHDSIDEIAKEDEKGKILNDIIDDKRKILYLRKNSTPDWKFLNELRKLDYGRTITFDGIKIANKRAFEMKECEMSEIGAEGCRKGKIVFNSNEDWMMKTNLIFTSNNNVEIL